MEGVIYLIFSFVNKKDGNFFYIKENRVEEKRSGWVGMWVLEMFLGFGNVCLCVV